ncbi:10591_t:CDS:2, partial [Cetraspora pellucida]
MIRSRFIPSITTQQTDDDPDLLKFCCRTTWFSPKIRRNKRKKNRLRSGGIRGGNNSKNDKSPLDDEEWEMLEDGELFRD